MVILNKQPRTKNNWLIDYFKGEDLFLVGSGASLKGFDFERLKNKKTIAINHSYMYMKSVDILLFIDAQFKTHFEKRGHNWSDYKTLTGPTSMLRHENVYVFNFSEKEISKNPHFLHGSVLSGLPAINAALISGAENIYLLGFDCCFVNNSRGHFYSHEWQHPNDGNEFAYTRAAKRFDIYSHHRNITNLSPHSKIEAFVKKNIDEVL